MWKHENEKCKRQVNLIGRAKFGNNIKQKSTTGGVYRLFVQRQQDGQSPFPTHNQTLQENNNFKQAK